jgi:O-antigen/teichoic acid export membrane protein
MTPERALRERRAIRRDVVLSVIIGPLKSVIPVAGYSVLYPLMLARAGASVLGLWSLFTAIAYYMTLSDVGFSLLLTREAGQDRSEVELRDVYKDYLAARRVYGVLGFVSILILLAGGKRIFISFDNIYPVTTLIVSASLLVVGTVVQLVSKLDAAILSARNDNHHVQLTDSITPVLSFSTAILGALLEKPIEGFAFGMLLANAARFFAYRWRLLRYHSEWQSAQVSLPLTTTFGQVHMFTRRGWHLYSISLANILREPTFRIVIVTTLGLEAAGVYDIAMRLTRTIREIVASGFVALYPALAYLYRTANKSDSRELMQVALLQLLAFGVGALGLLIMAADILLPLWLGNVPDGLVRATQILSLWNVITIANVPFWYLLQATGYEKVASLSLWIHTASVLLLIPIQQIAKLDLGDMLVYWTAGSILTQMMIYHYAERKLSLFWDVVLRTRVLLLLGIGVAFIVASFAVSGSKLLLDYLTSTTSFLIRFSLFVVYVSVVGFIIWGPLHQFVATYRKSAS